MKTETQLRNQIAKYEAEISTLRKLLLEKFDDSVDDIPELLRKERAEYIIQAPFFNRNERIIFQISKLTHVSMDKIMGKSREQNIISARFAAFYALKMILHLTYSDIGRLFNRNHATIIHGIRTFEDRAEFKQNIEYKLIKDIASISV